MVSAALLMCGLASLVLALGAPGLGWLLSTLTLVGACFATRRMSQWALFTLIGIAVVELFAFGPLSILGRQTPDQWTGVALMVALPLAAAAIALWRQQRQA